MKFGNNLHEDLDDGIACPKQSEEVSLRIGEHDRQLCEMHMRLNDMKL